MNISYDIPLPITSQSPDMPQECVGDKSWTSVVKCSMACLVVSEKARSGPADRSVDTNDAQYKQRSFTSVTRLQHCIVLQNDIVIVFNKSNLYRSHDYTTTVYTIVLLSNRHRSI